MTERLDVIRSGLAEVWQTQGRSFVTFEAAPGGEGEDAWIQYLDGELNLRWDRDEDPAVALARLGVALPRGAFVGYWTPRANAIIAVGDLLLDDVARLIHELFTVLAERAARIIARIEAHG